MKQILRTFIGTECIDEQIFANEHDAIKSTKGNYPHEGLNYELENEEGYIKTWKHKQSNTKTTL